VTRGEAASASSRVITFSEAGWPDDGAPGALGWVLPLCGAFGAVDWPAVCCCSCGCGCLAGNSFFYNNMATTESTIATMKFF